MHLRPRPRRFDVRASVWYRGAADERWRHGVSRSVSTTGALIATGDAAALGDEVVVVIALPGAGCLFGRGRVVRALASAHPEASTVFAIAVETFTIERRDSILNDDTPVLNGC